MVHDGVNGFSFYFQDDAGLYQAAKKLVNQQFVNNHAGPWLSKKLVDYFSV